MQWILFIFLFSTLYSRCPEDIGRYDVSDLDFETSYTSLSGHFIIHYDTTGINAPSLYDSDDSGISDYIEEVGIAAEAARFMLTDSESGLGYLEEIDDADGKYDIYIDINDGSSLWGQVIPINYTCSLDPNIVCSSLSCNDDDTCGENCGICESVDDAYEGSSYMRLRRSYSSDISNFCDNSNDLLWLTVGHEFFHSIQHAYKKNSTSTDRFYREFTSMWFENIFVPSCFDFLDFVDMSSTYGLFNHPERGFDDNASSGHYGYSLALYGHYLSTLIDSKGIDDQLNSTIMREVWEDYKESSSTIFNSLKDVLEENYSVSFSTTWADFMSRNMFCGEFSGIDDNEIYYHTGQSLINSPSIDYYNFDNYIWDNSLTLYDDRVNIYGFEALDGMTVNTNISDGDHIAWYGEISSQSFRDNVSDISIQTISGLSGQDKFFYLLSANNNSENIDLSIDIEVIGCTDPYALNYNSSANVDDESCEYQTEISIYPNPVNLSLNAINISLIQSETSEVNVEVFDLLGHSVYKQGFSIYGEGYHSISLGLMPYLSSGVYFLQVKHPHRAKTVKLINIK